MTMTASARDRGAQQRRFADNPLKRALISSLKPYAPSWGYSNANSNPYPNSNANSNANDANTVTANDAIAVNNGGASLLAKQIAPWSILIQRLSPVKETGTLISSSPPPPPLGTVKHLKKVSPLLSTLLSKSTSSPLPSSSSPFKRGHKCTMTLLNPSLRFRSKKKPVSLRPERVRAHGGIRWLRGGRLVHVPPLGNQREEERGKAL